MTMMVMAVALRETQKNGPRTNIVNTYYPGAEKNQRKGIFIHVPGPRA